MNQLKVGNSQKLARIFPLFKLSARTKCASYQNLKSWMKRSQRLLIHQYTQMRPFLQPKSMALWPQRQYQQNQNGQFVRPMRLWWSFYRRSLLPLILLSWSYQFHQLKWLAVWKVGVQNVHEEFLPIFHRRFQPQSDQGLKTHL